MLLPWKKKKIKWTGTILKVSASFHLPPNCATYLKLQNSLLLGRGGKRPLHYGAIGKKNPPQNKYPTGTKGTVSVKLTLVWTPSAKILKMQFQAQKEA